MKKLIGTKQFYKTVFMTMIPIAIQNAITNFVGLLDNIMIGQLGTYAITGISISNQLLTVFNLAIFGALSGPSIFNAQFFGKKDEKGMKDCFHFKLYIGLLILVIGCVLFLCFGKNLISLYISGSDIKGNALTLDHGMTYLLIMLVGLPPFVLSQIYSTSLRETDDTVLPMISSLIALSLNFIFNYLLIFGHFGFPELKIVGAAIATVLARYVEFIVLCVMTHTQKEKHPYFRGLYNSFKIDLDLTKRIIIKGFPLLVNEILWSSTIAAIIQCYSLRGIEVVAAVNINNTVNNTFMIICYAMGNAIAILVGRELGTGNVKAAYDKDLQMIFFNFMICIMTGLLLFVISGMIPELYNISFKTKQLTHTLLRITACLTPIVSLYYSSYFTLRAGGKTFLTFLFDSFYSLAVSFVIAFCLTHFTSLDIVMIYLCVQGADIVKAVLGIILVRKGIWLNDMVNVY